MESAEKTDPLSLVHPRAANVSVLCVDAGLSVTELAPGTLHLLFSNQDASRPFVSLSLRVDGSFVTLTVPPVLGLEYLREALSAAVPEGYLVLAHPSDEALIVTIARASEVEPTPHLFCTSYDTTLRARKVGTNRLLLKGVARGKGDIQLKVNEREFRLRLARGETPLSVSFRVREVLEATHFTLLSVPSTPGGDVVLTVLPRR